MAETEKRHSTHRAGILLKIFNHGFDGNAHQNETDEALFEKLRIKICELSFNPTIEDVFAACLKAEQVHEHLEGMGHLTNTQRINANSKVHVLFDLFMERGVNPVVND